MTFLSRLGIEKAYLPELLKLYSSETKTPFDLFIEQVRICYSKLDYEPEIELRLKEAFVDSLSMIQLVNLLNREFGVSLSIDWLVTQNPNPKQIAEKLRNSSVWDLDSHTDWKAEFDKKQIDKILPQKVESQVTKIQTIFLTGTTVSITIFQS